MYYLFHTKSFKLNAKSFVIKGTLLKRILPLGISSFLTQLSIVIIMGVMNSVLVRYGAMSKYGADIPMTVVGIGFIATVCFEIFPLQILGLFGSESDLYNEFGVKAFRLFLCTMILCCVVKATSIFLQSLGKPVMSMGLSLLRDFVLSVPLALFLPLAFGVEGPLLSAPVADVVTFVVMLIIMKKCLVRLVAI